MCIHALGATLATTQSDSPLILPYVLFSSNPASAPRRPRRRASWMRLPVRTPRVHGRTDWMSSHYGNRVIPYVLYDSTYSQSVAWTAMPIGRRKRTCHSESLILMRSKTLGLDATLATTQRISTTSAPCVRPFCLHAPTDAAQTRRGVSRMRTSCRHCHNAITDAPASSVSWERLNPVRVGSPV